MVEIISIITTRQYPVHKIK